MVTERLIATYRIETRYPLEQAAAALAGEQSSGTFRAVPGETPELLERFGARVEELFDEGEVEGPSLPGARAPASCGSTRPRRGLIRVSWNIENFGANLPTIWATVAGNSFELHQLSGLKLLDITFPERLTAHYPGPACGIEGTRRLTDIHCRPVIGTIIKPSVGLSPDETAAMADAVIGAGLDFLKDDELLAVLGREILFKGGQVGAADHFERVRLGLRPGESITTATPA